MRNSRLHEWRHVSHRHQMVPCLEVEDAKLGGLLLPPAPVCVTVCACACGRVKLWVSFLSKVWTWQQFLLWTPDWSIKAFWVGHVLGKMCFPGISILNVFNKELSTGPSCEDCCHVNIHSSHVVSAHWHSHLISLSPHSFVFLLPHFCVLSGIVSGSRSVWFPACLRCLGRSYLLRCLLLQRQPLSEDDEQTPSSFLFFFLSHSFYHQTNHITLPPLAS